MTSDELCQVRNKIIAQTLPSQGDDLVGMLIDFDHSLEQSPLLNPVSITRTADPNRMITATCEPASPTLSPAEIAAEVERIWMEELRYHHFEAHALIHTDEEIALEFVTVMQHGGYHVTGRISVDILKLDLPLKPVTLRWRHWGGGTIEAVISDGVNEATVWASFLSDAVGDLARALIALLQGMKSVRCDWQDEPGQYRWLLDRLGEELQIRILRFEEAFSGKLDEKGEPWFATRCQLRRFAAQVRAQLQRLLDGTEVGSDEVAWSRNYPRADFEKLDNLIRQAE